MVQSGEPISKGADTLFSEGEYRLLRRRLVRAVRKVCPSWLADQSDDLVQDALVSLMRRDLTRQDPTRQVPIRKDGENEENHELSQSYLMRTAYNKVVDEIRRRRVRREVPIEEEESEEPSIPDPGPDPDRELRRRLLGQAIQGCLETLIQPRRLAVTLYLHGHRAKEVARRLGWDTKRTENLIFRGRQDLQDCLEGKGFGR